MRHSSKYEMLLREFCNNKGVYALLELAKREQTLIREKAYKNTLKYPEHRDVIDMLYLDLCETLDQMAGEKLK